VTLALVAAPVIAAAEASAGGGLPVWVTILISLVVALGGGGTFFQLLSIRANKRNMNAGTSKARAEAADILSETALSLVIPLKEQVEHLSRQVQVLEQRLEQERATADTRIRQLEEDIASRDLTIQIKDAELIELKRGRATGSGWPSTN
jgi:hypothetical protein